MRKFIDIINEGLIKVDTSVLNTFQHFVAANVISWADQVYVDNKSLKLKNPTKYKYVQSEKASIDPNIWNVENEAFSKTLGMDFKNPYGEETVMLTLVFDLEGRFTQGSLGGFLPSNNAIIISPTPIIEDMGRLFFKGNNSLLRDMIDRLNETVHHELRHAVQYNFLHADQVARNDKYKSDKDIGKLDAYYTSPVEFDPIIGSTLHSFQIIMKANPKAEAKQVIRELLGLSERKITQGMTYDRTATSFQFYNALKRTDARKYRIAVKKFLTAIETM